MKDYLVSSIESTLSTIDLYIHLRQNKRARDHLSSVSKRARLKYHSILLPIVRRRFVSISKQPIYSSRAESSTHAAHYSPSSIRYCSISCSSIVSLYQFVLSNILQKKNSKKFVLVKLFLNI